MRSECARKKGGLNASPHKDVQSQAIVPAVTHHIGRGWGCPVNTQSWPSLQKGQTKSASSTTSQQCAPSPVPCSSCCRPDGPRLRPGFGPRETCDEAASFIRPASTHFTRQHNKARSAMLASQFWVGQLFATSSLRQKWLHQERHFGGGGCRQHAMLTPWWCPLPTAPRGTVATRQQ